VGAVANNNRLWPGQKAWLFPPTMAGSDLRTRLLQLRMSSLLCSSHRAAVLRGRTDRRSVLRLTDGYPVVLCGFGASMASPERALCASWPGSFG
jgi:hypothetical protein